MPDCLDEDVPVLKCTRDPADASKCLERRGMSDVDTSQSMAREQSCKERIREWRRIEQEQRANGRAFNG